MNATRLLSIPASIHEALAVRISRHSGEADENECTPWRATLDRYGYGRFKIQHAVLRKQTTAHRVAWILARGPILDGDLVIDHICRNRACVNVDHMELISGRENTLRGATPRRNRRALGLPEYMPTGPQKNPRFRDGREWCANGHPWSDETVREYVGRDGYLRRECKVCARERSVRWRAKAA